MPNRTRIEWATHTSNPIYAVDRETGRRGWFCTKVSAGCQNCYAEKLNKRLGNGLAFTEANRERVEWRLNGPELEAIRRMRKPARIFMCDMIDVFHQDVPEYFIDKVWAVMALAKQHTFQVLTKRPKRMLAHFGPGQFRDVGVIDLALAMQPDAELNASVPVWPLPNVWLGVTAENQKAADERIPLLLETPAAVRFVSCEPLLGPIDLGAAGALPVYREAETVTQFTSGKSDYIPYKRPGQGWQRFSGFGPYLDWVIVGGETAGPPERRLVEQCQEHLTCRMGWPKDRQLICGECGALNGWRPTPEALKWVRSIRDQCQAAGVPFFFKGWGDKKAGRLLDGREWSETP